MDIISVSFIAAIILGLTLLSSGVGKLRDPDGFVLGVLEYRILPASWAITYGRLLPLAEVMCAIALLAGVWRFGTGLLAISLLISFLIAVTINLARGRTLDCHCFGSRMSEPLGWTTVVRLCILLACAVAVTVIGWRDPVLVPHLPADPLPTFLIAVGMVIGLYLLSVGPTLWHIWRTSSDPGGRAQSRRVSLHSHPLPGER